MKMEQELSLKKQHFKNSRLVACSAVCLTSILVLTGCGGSGSNATSAPTGHILVASRGKAALAEYKIGASGSLSQIGADIPVPFAPSLATVTHNKRFLYVGSRDDARIAQYSISSTGELAPLSPAFITASGVNDHVNESMVVDSTDNALIYASQSVNSAGKASLSTFKIATDGTLHETQALTGSLVTAIAVGKTGNNVYAATTDIAGAVITQYVLNTSAGTLTAIGNVHIEGLQSPVYMIMDPDGQYLYLSDIGIQYPPVAGAPTYSGSVTALAINGSGGLTQIGTPLALSGSAPSFGLATTGGRVYVSDFNKNLLFLLEVSGGKLNRVRSYAVAPNPGRMTLDSTGKVLYLENNPSNLISSFNIASDGSLTATGTTPSIVFPDGLVTLP